MKLYTHGYECMLANLHDHTVKAKVVLKIKAHELTEIDLHQKNTHSI